ncbi:MAG: hypothetical protein WCN81_08555, partial [Actinomycetes bacterium]
IVSLIVFAEHRAVDWGAGAILSVGSVAGAWAGSRLSTHERAKYWIFRLLMVIVVAELIQVRAGGAA